MSNRGEIECWLTDMDGVLVHENHPLPGAAELLQQWRDQGKPYLVLTNNSIFTPRDLSARLKASGLDVPEDAIWTSALATADFLASQMLGVRHRRGRHYDCAA
jgi:NagD protein